MSAAPVPDAFVGVIAVIVFIVLVGIFSLALYSKGEVVRFWGRKVSYFTRMKNHRSLRVKIHRELIQTLTPNIEKILDELIFSDAKKKLKNDDVPKKLFEWWKKVKANRSKFQIWCYRFNRSWRYGGIRGRLVYCYCLFSMEEMAKKLGLHMFVQGQFLSKPLYVHAPTLEEYISKQLQRPEMQKKRQNPKTLKNLTKSYKFRGKGTYLATIFFPTALNISEESELSGRIEGLGNWFKIVTLGLRTFATKLANYETLKYTTDNIIEARRILELQIHDLKDVIGHESEQYQNLETVSKLLKIPVKITSLYEPLPTSVSRRKPEGAATESIKEATQAILTDPLMFFNWIMLIFGTAFSFIGFMLVIGDAKAWPMFLGGVMMLSIGVFLLYLRKRGEPPPTKKSKPFKKAED